MAFNKLSKYKNMKKINSIGYGGKVLGVGIILLAAVPLVLNLAAHFCRQPMFFLLGKISFVCGMVILVSFTIFLTIELHQDKKLNQYYESKKNERRPLKNNMYECEACGNRQVAPQDKSCHICGNQFKSYDKQLESRNDYKKVNPD